MDHEGSGQGKPAVEPAGAPLPAPRLVVPRWLQFIGVLLLAFLVWAVFTRAAEIVVLFVISAVIALFLNPLIHRMSRKRMPRAAAILLIYVAFLVVVGAIAFLLVNLAADEIRKGAKAFPEFSGDINSTLAGVQQFLNERHIDVHLLKPGTDALREVEGFLVRRSGDIASFTGDIVKTLASMIFDLFVILVTSIYMLVYGPRMGRTVRRLLPPIRTREDDLPWRIQRAVTHYVVGQIMLSGVMGLAAGLAMFVLGVVGAFPAGEPYAAFFGLWVFFMEFIPYIGPILGGVFPVFVALVTDPISAIWVLIVFLVLQELEGHVLAPQVFGRAIRINPIIVIFALLAGFAVHGIIGALISIPIVAVARELARYGYDHLALERWVDAVPATPGQSAGPTRCANCDRDVPLGLSCPHCRAPLGRQDPS